MEKVLVIDDDPAGLSAVSDALENEFEVITASNGREGIQLALEHRPDIILLGTEMSQMSGYQACEILKCEPVTHKTPIVFLSGTNRVRERMLGYELGAEEFLAKPVDAEEMQHRLKALNNRQKYQSELTERMEMATLTAMTAMAGNSELGLAVQFVENSYSLLTADDLASRVLRTIETIGLAASVLILTPEGNRHYSTRQDSRAMEEELMLAIHGQGLRFLDFGCRTQINYPKIALLIKNMPLADRDRYGRLKDLFPVILGAADARLRSMETEQALLSQSQDLARSFIFVEQTLKEQSSSLQMTQQQVARVVRALWQEFEVKLPNLGLDDDQEKYLMSHIEKALEETNDAMEQSEALRASFDSVLRMFKHLTDRQQKIVNDFMAKPAAAEATPAVDANMDVELF